MIEAIITRTAIITVDAVGSNTYGDMTFTDKSGGQYKISAKRKQYFENVIAPGAAIQLSYSSFKGKEYVYSATQVKDILPGKPLQAPEPISSPIEETGGRKPLGTKDEQIEKAVWVKELGECIRAGIMEDTWAKAYKHAYFIEMGRVMGIKSKEVQPLKSRLVEEAKKLGAVKIEEGDIPF